MSVGPWDGTPTQEIGTFDGVTIDSTFDTGCELSFNIPSNSAAANAIGELDTDVWFYAAETIEHRFRVVSLEESWDGDGVGQVAVTAICYKKLIALRHHLSWGGVSGVDQDTLLHSWIVIDAQEGTNGDLGITVGTLDSDTERQRSWELGDSIGKGAEDLQGVIDGPWWEIDGNLQLQVKDQDDFPTARTPLVLGGVAITMKRRSAADRFANVAIVNGDSETTDPVIFETPGLSTDTRGRWEIVEGTSIQLQSTLQERAEATVDAGLHPITMWEATIDPTRFLLDAGYQVGMFVPVVRPPSNVRVVGVTGAKVLAQVMNVTLTLDAAGVASVSLTALEVPE